MTRLKTEDIAMVNDQLQAYNNSLIAKTGYTLMQIAAYAAGIEEEDINPGAYKLGVIPLTCGQGIISRFSETVAGIVSFLGFEAFVTGETDAGGIAEAVSRGADVIMLADDDRFVAINLAAGKVVDNGEATGRGYVAALDLMMGGLANRKVLVLGAGPVGEGAAFTLGRFEALIAIYDPNLARSQAVGAKVSEAFDCYVRVEDNFDKAVLRHKLFIDACPAPEILDERHLTDRTVIAAPGIPLGIKETCVRSALDRLIHDPLEIGVATMIVDAVKPV